MSDCRRSRWTFLILAVPLALYLAAHGAARSANAQDTATDVISRGKYLVTDAGQCTDCHGQTFAGGPNHFTPPPGVPWAKTIPSLVGLPMFKNDADAVRFLSTAKLPDGSSALRPMPHYNFNVADATAIVAYLRSLH